MVGGGIRGCAAVRGGAGAGAVTGLTHQSVFTRAFALDLLQILKDLFRQALQLCFAVACQMGLILQRQENSIQHLKEEGKRKKNLWNLQTRGGDMVKDF